MISCWVVIGLIPLESNVYDQMCSSDLSHLVIKLGNEFTFSYEGEGF